jgi:hypothetical protein
MMHVDAVFLRMETYVVPKASPAPLPELATYLVPFASLFRRATSRASLERYVTGLRKPSPPMTVELVVSQDVFAQHADRITSQSSLAGHELLRRWLKRLRSLRWPLWGTPHDGGVHVRLWPEVLGPPPAEARRTNTVIQASSPFNNVVLTLCSKRSCSYEPVHAFGQFPRWGAEAPIQNGRPRRCGNGPGNVSLHHPSPCENRGGRA